MRPSRLGASCTARARAERRPARPRALLWILALLMTVSPRLARGQCVSDLRRELAAAAAISDSLVRLMYPEKTASVKRTDAEGALRNAQLFGAKAAIAGPSSICLLARRPQFEQAAIAALASDTTKAVSREELRNAIADGFTSVLGERYQATDRVSLVLGIAMTYGLDRKALESWKVVSHIDTVVVNGARTAREQRFIANDSRSRTFPSATTGVLVRVRDSDGGLLRKVTPNGVFGSVQISGAGGTGPVNGASLGLSWKFIPAAHLLVGYSVTRNRTLRHDLRDSYPDKVKTLIPLPPGETEQTILGTSSTNGIMVSLALPVGLASSLGVR